jgi:hypothetical protein
MSPGEGSAGNLHLNLNLTRAQHQQKRDYSEEEATSPGDPTFTSDQSKKRRTTGSSSSSRGVANLTPDQLAKKRANDREAQRAIRERTKNQIENLERRIRHVPNMSYIASYEANPRDTGT